MAYPYYPYQQPYYPAGMTAPVQPAQPMPAAQPQPVQQGPSFALVNNEQEARDFVVLPGNSVFLMNRNDPVFWLKTTDQSGLSAPLRAFDYTERTQGAQVPAQAAQAPGVEYVPRSEYDALAARVEALEAKKCACKGKTVKEDAGNE